MKRIVLTKMVQIPDETFVPTKKQPNPPTATNYAGAVLEVSDELAERLMGEGSAVEAVQEKAPVAEAAASDGVAGEVAQ